MEQRRPLGPPEFILEVFAEPTCVKDIVRGARTADPPHDVIADMHQPYYTLSSSTAIFLPSVRLPLKF